MQSLTASASYSFDKSVNHVSAVADGTQWTDFAASSFEGGEGTAESPYLIKPRSSSLNWLKMFTMVLLNTKIHISSWLLILTWQVMSGSLSDTTVLLEMIM